VLSVNRVSFTEAEEERMSAELLVGLEVRKEQPQHTTDAASSNDHINI
jgi:hypothetical protein